jgi:hypothetical protein
MVEPNPKNRLNPEQYNRLKAEMVAPYRGLRQFIYFGVGASGFIGAFTFFFKLLAGKDIEHTLRVVMRKAPALQPGDISEQDEFIHP